MELKFAANKKRYQMKRVERKRN